MTMNYILSFNPKWYVANLIGLPLGGGYIATFSSLNHTQLKPIFEDPAGQFPWPYVVIPNVGSLGVLFDENGTQGPFYFEFDTNNPDDLYYIEVYDSKGNLQWTLDNFLPSDGSGGGSVITTALDLENLVINNVMWRNLGNGITNGNTFLNLCPGASAGLAKTASNYGPDVNFIKNNNNATDFISFPLFDLGDNLLTGDVTPVDYLNYACTNNPTGETFKYVQFPITKGVQNLSNQIITVSIWAKCAAGSANTLDLQISQFFGDGGNGSLTIITPIQTLTLANNWQRYSISLSVPNISGLEIGFCGNDGLFLQIQYPLNSSCNISFTKPCMYLGNLSPVIDFHSYDMIDAVINSPRTGNVKIGYDVLDTSTMHGYLGMNDGTIGSPSSGSTTRAATDTFPLYNLLWNNVSDTWAPVIGGRGADAISDFVANKPLTLTRALGRVLGQSGSGQGLTPRDLGQFIGEETHTQTIAELAAHTHDAPPGHQFWLSQGGLNSGGGATPFSVEDSTASTGSSTPFNVMQPTSFANYFIKL